MPRLNTERQNKLEPIRLRTAINEIQKLGITIINCFIYAKEKAKRNGAKIDWIITSDNKDYSNDKVYYICRWLNHSFMPFTAKQEKLYLKFREKYDLIHNKNNNL